MPDITMCEGTGRTDNLETGVLECPLKETCFRFKATPSEFRQAYFITLPYDQKTATCKWLIPLSKKELIERMFP